MEGIFITLINHSIQAGWLILAVIAVRFLFRKMPKKYVVLMWAIVAVRLLVPVSLETSYSLVPKNQEIISDDGKLEMIQPVYRTDKISDAASPLNESNQSDPGISGIRVGRVASIIWMAGIIIFSFLLLWEYWKLKRKVAPSISEKNRVRICDEVNSPFLFGLWNPFVYLPSDMPKEYEEYVLAHEYMHLKRHDNWWKLVGLLLVIVYWFQPLVWIAYGLFCRDLEFSCDERVIEKLEFDKRQQYSKVLVLVSTGKKQPLIYKLCFGEVRVKERVTKIMNYKKPKFWVAIISLALIVILAVCFATNSKLYSGKISSKLEEKITESILKNNKCNYTDENYACEDHVLLGMEEKEKIVTVYLMCLYEEYSNSGNQLREESGAHYPIALTFEGDDKIGYQLKEYWVPEDGSDYLTSIKKKFPMRLWKNASDTQKYIEEQEKHCKQKAEDYFSNLQENSTSQIETGEELSQIVDHKSLDEVKNYLKTFSNDAKELEKEGCFVSIHGKNEAGATAIWNAFIQNVNQQKPTDIVFAQYTTEGDVVLDYLEYNGRDFYHVNDSSRDNFGGTGNSYHEETYPYLKLFQEMDENGDYNNYIVLTKDNDVTFDMFYQDYYNSADDQVMIDKYRVLLIYVSGNSNSEITAEESFNDLSYNYDMGKVLIPRDKITKIEVQNGNTGENQTFSVLDGSNTFNEIVDLYEKLDVALDENMGDRSGYAYLIRILDENNQCLQVVTPYKDAVCIDGNMYDGHLNGSTYRLLYKLDSLNGTQNEQ